MAYHDLTRGNNGHVVLLNLKQSNKYYIHEAGLMKVHSDLQEWCGNCVFILTYCQREEKAMYRGKKDHRLAI